MEFNDKNIFLTILTIFISILIFYMTHANKHKFKNGDIIDKKNIISGYIVSIFCFLISIFQITKWLTR